MATKPTVPETGSYVMIAETKWSSADLLIYSLNNELECAIAELLRFDKVIGTRVHGWAKAMCNTVGGYGDWFAVIRYIEACLSEKLEDPGDKQSAAVGDQSDMVKLLSTEQLASWNTAATDIDLALIRTRVDVLKSWRAKNPDLGEPVTRLFRKINYAYKLWEALIGQVGYYNGSLELQANIIDDFEAIMYLMQMKLRKPNRQFLVPAAKSMMCYLTEPESLLPWNNQFSFSMGHHEFGADEMPAIAKSDIEEQLLQVVFSDDRWKKLCALLGWSPVDNKLAAERLALKGFYQAKPNHEGVMMPTVMSGPVDLANLPDTLMVKAPNGQMMPLKKMGQQITLAKIIYLLRADEVKRKAFFTLILGFTWSDELLPLEHNVFREVIKNDPINAQVTTTVLNVMLSGDAIKDVRLTNLESRSPVERLTSAKQFFNVVGRNSNVLVTPRSALGAFKAKLAKMSPKELAFAYQNIKRTSTAPIGMDEIMAQAENAANHWLANVLGNRKPIYTGPSGHALTYICLYARSREHAAKLAGVPLIAHSSADTPNPVPPEIGSSGVQVAGQPTLRQARLVILAALIGFNQHHSYDEVMYASHGVKMLGDTMLSYTDRLGYRDLINVPINDPDADIARRIATAAFSIAQQALQQLASWKPVQPPSNAAPSDIEYYKFITEMTGGYADTVKDWYKNATEIEYKDSITYDKVKSNL